MVQGRKPKKAPKNLIRSEYEAGAQYAELSAKYGIKAGTISSWVAREGWERHAGKSRRTDGMMQTPKPGDVSEAWAIEVERLKGVVTEAWGMVSIVVTKFNKEKNEGNPMQLADVALKTANAIAKLVGTSKLLYQNAALITVNDMTKEQEQVAINDLTATLATVKLHAVK